MNKGRIAVVYEPPNLDTVPSLCNAAVMLSRAGYQVDIYTKVSPEYQEPYFNEENVRLYVSHSEVFVEAVTRSRRADIVQLQKRNILYFLARYVYRLGLKGIRFVSALAGPVKVLGRHLKNPYRCFIGVDPEGLVRANTLSRLTGVPLVYYSLELMLKDEIRDTYNKLLKQHEVVLSQRSVLVLIQDSQRAKIIADDNQLRMEKFIFVPNSPLGPARRKKSDYWHKQFGLSDDKRVVLHSGSVKPWTAIESIVDSVKNWPKKWVLVIHRRDNPREADDINELKKRAAKNRVFFSPKAVSRKQYDTLVDAADIGVAFYIIVPGSIYAQRNLQTIGLSSGKVAYYLRAGVPVITNKVTSLGELINRNNCGVSVDSALNIGQAIAMIEEAYDSYSNRSCEAFDKIFSFERGFNKVIKRIDEMER